MCSRYEAEIQIITTLNNISYCPILDLVWLAIEFDQFGEVERGWVID
jgi:hypothetical protein